VYPKSAIPVHISWKHSHYLAELYHTCQWGSCTHIIYGFANYTYAMGELEPPRNGKNEAPYRRNYKVDGRRDDVDDTMRAK